jgi:hypothetical protein
LIVAIHQWFTLKPKTFSSLLMKKALRRLLRAFSLKSEAMSDLETAKRYLREKGYSLVIAKAGRIVFATRQSGVSGFLRAIDKFSKDDLVGSSVADRVVGRAAAMLCLYCAVKAVYAVVLSEGGKELLEKNRVPFQFESLVPNILNRQKTGTCPFEQMVSAIPNAEEAYEKLKSCINK